MPSKGVQNTNECLKNRRRTSEKLEKVKRWIGLAKWTIIEFFCCLFCLIWSLEIVQITSFPIRFALVRLMPILVSVSFLSVTYVDIISWTSMRPITYHTWLMVSTTGFVLFYLSLGCYFLYNVTATIFWGIALSFITGTVFLLDLICLLRSYQRFPVTRWMLLRRREHKDQCVCAGDFSMTIEAERPICRCGDTWDEPCKCDQMKCRTEDTKSIHSHDRIIYRTEVTEDFTTYEPSFPENVVSTATEMENEKTKSVSCEVEYEKLVRNLYCTDQLGINKKLSHSKIHKLRTISPSIPATHSVPRRSCDQCSKSSTLSSIKTGPTITSSKIVRKLPSGQIDRRLNLQQQLEYDLPSQPEDDYCIRKIEDCYDSYLPGQVVPKSKGTLCSYPYSKERRHINVSNKIVHTQSGIARSALPAKTTERLHKATHSGPKSDTLSMDSRKNRTISMQTETLSLKPSITTRPGKSSQKSPITVVAESSAEQDPSLKSKLTSSYASKQNYFKKLLLNQLEPSSSPSTSHTYKNEPITESEESRPYALDKMARKTTTSQEGLTTKATLDSSVFIQGSPKSSQQVSTSLDQETSEISQSQMKISKHSPSYIQDYSRKSVLSAVPSSQRQPSMDSGHNRAVSLQTESVSLTSLHGL